MFNKEMGFNLKILSGDEFRKFISLSIPITVTNILQTLYSIIDLYWVGSLGKEAVAAISVSFPIIMLFFSVGMGITGSSAILVAHSYGRRDREEMKAVSASSFLMIFLIAFSFAALGFLFSRQIIEIVGGSDIKDALSYLRVSFIALFFMLLFMWIQSLYRNLNVPEIPLYIVILTLLLNYFLDPILIYGNDIIPSLGVVGAAVVTTFTSALSFVVAFVYGRIKNLPIEIINHWDMEIIKNVLTMGIPISITNVLRSSAFVVFLSIISYYGIESLASYGITLSIFRFVIISLVGFSIAVGVLMGHSYGAKDVDGIVKLLKLSLFLTIGLFMIISLLLFLLSEHIVAFFVTDPVVIEKASLFVKIMSISFPFLGVFFVINGLFRGVGDTVTPLWLVLFSFWIVRIPLSIIFSNSIGDVGVILSFPVSDFLTAIASLFLTMEKIKEIKDNVKIF